ncbi:cupredoxin domain-containing protein [Amphritea sp. HPY]|uniref:cupredoxin domain-containing protein n=1 Tax=Amphritea sp. HPY TaxID=3421652 RepID=UPI003D7D7026
MTKQRLLLATISLILCSGFTAADTVEVEIYKFQFSPAEITINVGDTVVWVNKEKRQYHNVWFEQLDEEETDYLFPGDSYEKTFAESGSFPYRCGPHPEMTATVIVNDQ